MGHLNISFAKMAISLNTDSGPLNIKLCTFSTFSSMVTILAMRGFTAYFTAPAAEISNIAFDCCCPSYLLS